MAHRTLKDIEAIYRFGLPEGRLNGKGREASLSIASSQSPAVLPGNGSTTRVRDPSNSAPTNQIGSGSRYTHRPLDTRRYRVNKIEGEEEPSRTGTTSHRTPRPPWPCPVWVERDVQLAFFAVCRPAAPSIQALVFRFPTREED